MEDNSITAALWRFFGKHDVTVRTDFQCSVMKKDDGYLIQIAGKNGTMLNLSLEVERQEYRSGTGEEVPV